MRKTLNIDEILEGIDFDRRKAIEYKECGLFPYANMRLDNAMKRLDALDIFLDREQKTYYGIKTRRLELIDVLSAIKKAEDIADQETNKQCEVA